MPCYFSERLKLSLTTETKAWCVAFGKACNEKYRTEMDEILEFIDDITKKLNRPIKDLDDIRLAMKALKDVRENEIRIDMAIGPIEVCFGGIRALFRSKVAMMSPCARIATSIIITQSGSKIQVVIEGAIMEKLLS